MIHKIIRLSKDLVELLWVEFVPNELPKSKRAVWAQLREYLLRVHIFFIGI